MAFMDLIEINGDTLPFPDSYNVDIADVEADSSGETEAGTKQRDVVRTGVPTISVTFSVSKTWLERLSYYRNQSILNVRYFATDTLDMKSAEMYIEGFKAALAHDTSKKGLWTVSFNLKSY